MHIIHAPFEQFDVWLLLDFECAMPSARARSLAPPHRAGVRTALTETPPAMRRAFVLKPRPKLSGVIKPAKCEPKDTTEERVDILQQQYDDYELRSAACGRPASCGKVQHAVFGYAQGRKLGLRSTARSAQAYSRGACRALSIGECRRRGPECCTRLNYAYFEYGPSEKKHSKGMVQPITSTGEAYAYCYEPLFQQGDDCEVETSNYNPMQCVFRVSYKMAGKPGARKLVREAPHCYAPTEYLPEEQRAMDFVQRYVAAPNRLVCCCLSRSVAWGSHHWSRGQSALLATHARPLHLCVCHTGTLSRDACRSGPPSRCDCSSRLRRRLVRHPARRRSSRCRWASRAAGCCTTCALRRCSRCVASSSSTKAASSLSCRCSTILTTRLCTSLAA